MNDIEITKALTYATHDGVALQGDFYAPKGAGKHPAIVAMHGGGWQLGSRDTYGYWGEYLAARGWALFAISYRFAKPREPGYPHCVNDVRAAVQFLRGKAAELRIDPDRLGLMGDSAGGHLAALVALAGDAAPFAGAYPNDAFAKLSTKVKVAVPVYGVFDLAAQWMHDQRVRFRDHITEKLLGAALPDNRRVFFEASPLSYATSAGRDTAFLVVYGADDDVVDCRTQSEAFIDALKMAQIFVRKIEVAGAGHFFWSDPIAEEGGHTGFAAPRLVRFLETRL